MEIFLISSMVWKWNRRKLTVSNVKKSSSILFYTTVHQALFETCVFFLLQSVHFALLCIHTSIQTKHKLKTIKIRAREKQGKINLQAFCRSFFYSVPDYTISYLNS